MEADLNDEFRSHLEQEVESNVRAGMTPTEAQFAAQRLLGPESLYKEECRDAYGMGWIDSFVRDFRYAIRMLRRTPLFAAAAIITLALSIGANTTVFTFVENILLGSLPVANPEQLKVLNWGGMTNMSYPNYLDFRNRNSSFANIVAYRLRPVSMSLQARDNVRVWGFEATGNYFATLGIQPELGRFFTPSEDTKAGANPVMVISDQYWRAHFAGDPKVVGRSVKVNGYRFTVIGVAPRSFTGTEFIIAADFWVPVSMEAQIEPGNRWLSDRGSQQVWTMGRLRRGVSPQQAEANLDSIARQIARSYPNDLDEKASFNLSRPGLIGQALRQPATHIGMVLMSVAGLVLLLACINLAGMLLARAADRRREIGIRLALGASRMRLLRQLLTESLILAVSGGLLGLVVALIACRLFSSWRLDFDFPARTVLHPDATVLCFTLAMVLGTTVLFGLVPALQATGDGTMPSLKGEAPTRRFSRWAIRDFLVAGQIALSMVLVICSVLVVRSLQHALTLNLGFNPANAVSVSFDLKLQGYSQERSQYFDQELVAKASAIPGLEGVGIIDNLPLRLGENNTVISRADRPVPPRSDWQAAIVYEISPGYLRAAGTSLLRGRDVNSYDRKNTPRVALVNEALTRLLFPNENPLGKHVRLSANAVDKGVEIVGVVETGKYEFLSEDPHPAILLPLAQSDVSMTTLVARSSLPASAATDLLRKTVLDLDPELTLFNVGSLSDQLAMPLFPARIAAIVLGIFGLLAMVLAATGLFALMAYTVSRRAREIAIRMALGARPRQVLVAVLWRTFVLCFTGLLFGTIITLVTGRLLSAVLYGVSPQDPFTYIAAVLIMIAVALLACWRPVARAIHIDPARILREQ